MLYAPYVKRAIEIIMEREIDRKLAKLLRDLDDYVVFRVTMEIELAKIRERSIINSKPLEDYKDDRY